MDCRRLALASGQWKLHKKRPAKEKAEKGPVRWCDFDRCPHSLARAGFIKGKTGRNRCAIART